jgi:hypothetical protein
MRGYTYIISAVFLSASGCSSSDSQSLNDSLQHTDSVVLDSDDRYFDSLATIDRQCPKGHFDSIVPIVYGLPTMETIKRAERGEVSPGGCVVDSVSPQWHCKIHDIDFTP